MMEVGHYVMTEFGFQLRHAPEIERVPGGSHRVHGLHGHLDSQLALRLGQSDPQVSPQDRLPLGREEVGHLGRRVAIDQGMRIARLGRGQGCLEG